MGHPIQDIDGGMCRAISAKEKTDINKDANTLNDSSCH